jgi:hypothetical protein
VYMKNASTQFLTHLQGELTTLATNWLVIRRDGTIYGFTDGDMDTLFLPVTGGDVPVINLPDGGFGFWCLAGTGFTRSNLADKAQLEVSNVQADGIVDADMITEWDIRARLWDYAFVIVSAVNWADWLFTGGTSGDIRLFTGQFGPVTLREYKWQVEMKGLADQLNRVTGSLYQPTCRVDLGSPECGVNLTAFILNLDPIAAGFSILAATSAAAGHPASGAIDGNPLTYWEATGSPAGPSSPSTWQTLDVDLGASRVMASFTLVVPNDPALGQPLIMRAYYSTDGTTWTPAYPAGWNGNPVDPGGSFEFGGTFPTISTGQTTTAFQFYSQYTGQYLRIVFESVYGGGQGFNLAVSEITVAVATAGGSLTQTGGVVVTDGWRTMSVGTVTAADAFYDGGLLTWLTGGNAYTSSEIRQWVSNVGSAGGTVTLFLKTIYPITVGDSFIIQPGCDKLLSTCKAKFNNVINFRGEPSVPTPDRLLDYPDFKPPHSG